MLTLIGLGLNDEKDISVKGLEFLKNSDQAYIETYTNIWRGNLGELERMAGKEIVELERGKVESDFLIELAREKNVCLLVPGDPLSATTHYDLVHRARNAGIPVRIIHSSSVFTAVAETGLHLYKFGRTATIPYPRRGYRPLSFIDAVLDNLEKGMHTLLLVDTVPEMNPGIAFSLLREASEEKGLDIGKVLLCMDLGGKSDIRYVELSNPPEDFSLPFCIIVPGKLHFTEESAIRQFMVE